RGKNGQSGLFCQTFMNGLLGAEGASDEHAFQASYHTFPPRASIRFATSLVFRTSAKRRGAMAPRLFRSQPCPSCGPTRLADGLGLEVSYVNLGSTFRP